MTQAFNLSQLANSVNTSGQLNASAINGTVPNATNASTLTTTNFTIIESGGKLVFKYGTTVIASMDSSGNIVSSNNISAYGTP